MRTKKWIAMICALFCALHIAAPQVEAETHHGFLVQKSVEVTETLGKMAASEEYLSFFFIDRPTVGELAKNIGAGDFGKPDEAVIIQFSTASEELLWQLVIANLMDYDPSIDLSLFADTEVKEMVMARMIRNIPFQLLARHGQAWIALNTVVALVGEDDLPEGLSGQTYVALVYHEAQVVSLITFFPNDRWRFVSYSAHFIPYDSNLGTGTIQELLSAELVGWEKIVWDSLRIISLTSEEVSGLLSK
ncbi:MAG: hypothetical protein FWD25_03240 [Clostridia bacterium]|nr:hypothetical protein [Clostridia bacterium]